MSTCQCCLTPHPTRLLERFNLSIQTIKLIRQNCSIFQTILLDECEHIERISTNLNKYLMQYGNISHQIFSYLSQYLVQLNYRLEYRTKCLYNLECLTIQCSIWLKTNSIKTFRSQIKHFNKQFDIFNHFMKQNSNKDKFWKDFSLFQTNYQQQCLQMDAIEREHLKIFFKSISIFFSIISTDNSHQLISNINLDDHIHQWKEQNKFRIIWIPDEHHQNENTIEQSSSDIEIKALEYCPTEESTKYVYESDLNWAFIIANKPIDETSNSSEPTIDLPKSRVRLAIEAIEQKTR